MATVLDPQMPVFEPVVARAQVLKIAIVIGPNTLSIEGPFTVPEAVSVIHEFVVTVGPMTLPLTQLPALTAKLSAATTALEHSVETAS